MDFISTACLIQTYPVIAAFSDRTARFGSILWDCFDTKLYIFWLLGLVVIVLLHLNGKLISDKTDDQTKVPRMKYQEWPNELCDDNFDGFTNGCRNLLVNRNFTAAEICTGLSGNNTVSKCSLACIGSVRTFNVGWSLGHFYELSKRWRFR